MSITSILSRYIARQFLVGFFALLVVLAGLIWLIEFVELVRRVSNQPDGTVGLALQLSLLKVPETMELLFHFAILFAAMFTFWRLTRSQELVVARAAGISVWQFLWPVIFIAAVIGILKVTLVNPITAAVQLRYEALEARVIRGQESVLDVSRGGLWLRQAGADGSSSILFAARALSDEVELADVIVFRFDENGDFVSRIDATEALLRDGEWHLVNAWLTEGGMQPRRVEAVTVPTDLTAESIQDSFAPPSTMSFWSLPDFIELLEETGFSATRHRLHFHSLLAQPLLMAAMVLFAATFSLRMNTRRGGGSAMMLAGAATAILLFMLSDVIFALGMAETVPVILAAWTPAGFSALVATALLLHFEDG
ncbi:MAG: LPS export ABC transporter permease LptG [Azospirillaceae bacterium]